MIQTTIFVFYLSDSLNVKFNDGDLVPFDSKIELTFKHKVKQTVRESRDRIEHSIAVGTS